MAVADIKVAVIGAGWIATHAHVPGHKKAEANLAAIADIVPGLAEEVAHEYRIPRAYKMTSQNNRTNRHRLHDRSEARTHDDFLESHLELWDRSDPADPKLLPGYGWIFGLGDGTVNVGLGMLNSSKAFGRTDYRALLRTWLDGTPEEWGLREENAIGPIGGAGLPMGFNRTPHYARRAAAGRRRRRRGQPVQRRGHRLRHGVRGAGRRVLAAGPRPPDGPARRRRCTAIRPPCRLIWGSTTGSAGCSPR